MLVVNSRVDVELREYLASSGLQRTFIYDLINHAGALGVEVCTVPNPNPTPGVDHLFDLRVLAEFLRTLQHTINYHASTILRQHGSGDFQEPRIRILATYTVNEDGSEVASLFFYRRAYEDRASSSAPLVLGKTLNPESYN